MDEEAKYANIMIEFERLHTRMELLEDELGKMKSVLEDANLYEKAEHIAGLLAKSEFSLTEAYREFRFQVEDNQKRFSNMINEYKGMVSIERSRSVAKARAILKVLEEP